MVSFSKRNWAEIAEIILASTMSAAMPVMSQNTILLTYFHDSVLYGHILKLEGNTLKTLNVFVKNLMAEIMAV